MEIETGTTGWKRAIWTQQTEIYKCILVVVLILSSLLNPLVCADCAADL